MRTTNSRLSIQVSWTALLVALNKKVFCRCGGVTESTLLDTSPLKLSTFHSKISTEGCSTSKKKRPTRQIFYSTTSPVEVWLDARPPSLFILLTSHVHVWLSIWVDPKLKDNTQVFWTVCKRFTDLMEWEVFTVDFWQHFWECSYIEGSTSEFTILVKRPSWLMVILFLI